MLKFKNCLPKTTFLCFLGFETTKSKQSRKCIFTQKLQHLNQKLVKRPKKQRKTKIAEKLVEKKQDHQIRHDFVQVECPVKDEQKSVNQKKCKIARIHKTMINENFTKYEG